MQVSEAINMRTSYRGKYKNTPVNKDDLRKIMEAGVAAPSGCNKQTTSFIAVEDSEVLDKLNKIMAVPARRVAPAMICVLTQRIIAYGDTCLAVQDYAAAIENMLLSIVDLGYQSCWIEGQITGDNNLGRKMADVLDVPRDYELICVLPVGYADEAITRVAKKDFAKRAWFNGFQKKER